MKCFGLFFAFLEINLHLVTLIDLFYFDGIKIKAFEYITF